MIIFSIIFRRNLGLQQALPIRDPGNGLPRRPGSAAIPVDPRGRPPLRGAAAISLEDPDGSGAGLCQTPVERIDDPLDVGRRDDERG